MSPPTPNHSSSGLRPVFSLIMPPMGCSIINRIRPTRLIQVAVIACEP
ncbi:Uncharacterised protein [Mycobacterium tuberculosis]|uniref:Uncharacterized protein n=1 Tax=Mycobacterium tuberculosis TaxID=1773 RepID=A0A655AP75_MYCTX|nr:Uncharacterised protein [Mycobacterium tuberculosis]